MKHASQEHSGTALPETPTPPKPQGYKFQLRSTRNVRNVLRLSKIDTYHIYISI
jgi:hypothetical protein